MMLQSTVTSAPKTLYSRNVPSLRGRVPAALEIDVGAVSAGEVHDDRGRVLRRHVDGLGSAAAPCEVETLSADVEGDHLGRRLRRRPGDHAQSDRAASGDDDHVVERDTGSLDRM